MDEIKKVLKVWERSFFKENQRKPTSKDINDADEIVKENYKRYSELRKSQKEDVWGACLNKKTKTPLKERDDAASTNNNKSAQVSHIRQRIFENTLKTPQPFSHSTNKKLNKITSNSTTVSTVTSSKSSNDLVGSDKHIDNNNDDNVDFNIFSRKSSRDCRLSISATPQRVTSQADRGGRNTGMLLGSTPRLSQSARRFIGAGGLSQQPEPVEQSNGDIDQQEGYGDVDAEIHVAGEGRTQVLGVNVNKASKDNRKSAQSYSTAPRRRTRMANGLESEDWASMASGDRNNNPRCREGREHLQQQLDVSFESPIGEPTTELCAGNIDAKTNAVDPIKGRLDYEDSSRNDKPDDGDARKERLHESSDFIRNRRLDEGAVADGVAGERIGAANDPPSIVSNGRAEESSLLSSSSLCPSTQVKRVPFLARTTSNYGIKRTTDRERFEPASSSSIASEINDEESTGLEAIFGRNKRHNRHASDGEGVEAERDEIEDGDEQESKTTSKSNSRKRQAEEIDDRENDKSTYPGVELTDKEARICAPESKKLCTTSKRAPKSATDDGNYLKINLKIKKYRPKGGSSLTGAQYKRQQYKELTQGSKRGRPGWRPGGKTFSFQGQTCHKCGGEGHWARDCKGRYKKVDSELKPDGEVPSKILVRDDNFLSMNEALRLARGIKRNKTGDDQTEKLTPEDLNDDSEELSVIRESPDEIVAPPSAPPYYNVDENGITPECTKDVMKALKIFGHSSFRPGQEKAVMRILSGQSTLVVLSTGAGKSLCYQLPAYMYAKRKPNTLTLVVSPLVSLMDDQVKGLPPGVNGACYHGNQNKAQKQRITDGIACNRFQFLLVSPETLVGGSTNALPWLQNDGPKPPEIAFACIDEVHCVSQWSHHFRPSYLRLIMVLRETFGVRCILGLTATATQKTVNSISRALNIHDSQNACVRGKSVPENLQLSISRDDNKDQALIELLKGELYSGLDSIVIYCTRRQQTEHVATVIRTCMYGFKSRKNLDHVDYAFTPEGYPSEQDTEHIHSGGDDGCLDGEGVKIATDGAGVEATASGEENAAGDEAKDNIDGEGSEGEGVVEEGSKGKKVVKKKGKTTAKKKKVAPKKQSKKKATKKKSNMGPEEEWTSDFYHAGQSAACRRRVQTSFMSGNLRVVVATVAFGMGLDKSDIRGIIHYSMPKSYESYVQEIGRAGRDGKPAFCHLFIDKDGGDENELRRHIFGNTIDSLSIKKLVRKLYPACKCQQANEKMGFTEICQGHERALPIEKLVNKLDCKEEGLETLLCYLELHDNRYLTNMRPCYATCTLSCYDGPQQLQSVATRCPPVAVAIAAEKRRGVKSHAHSTTVEFDVVAVSDLASWSSAVVRRELRGLQWQASSRGGVEKSGVIVEFSDLAFRVRSRGDFTPDEIDDITNYLITRLTNQERSELVNLKTLYETFYRLSNCSVYSCIDKIDLEKSNALKRRIMRYFNETEEEIQCKTECQALIDREEDEGGVQCAEMPFRIPMDLGSARGLIASFIGEYGNNSEYKFTGRSVARVFHGIASPCFPAEVWGRLRSYWRKLLFVDFNVVRKLADQRLSAIRLAR